MNIRNSTFLKNTKFVIKKNLYNYQKFTVDKVDREALRRKKKVFVFSTPEHGNLGDHAIAYAQQRYLQKVLPEYYYYELPIHTVLQQLKLIKNIINEDDLIFIHGGGNMGTLYPYNEKIRRTIVQTFKNNPIIQFPQSTLYEDTLFGFNELQKSKKAYGANKNVTLIAREKTTLEFMRENFTKSVIELIPDIVLTLDLPSEHKREGILTCFRDDKEKNISHEYTNHLLDELRKQNMKLSIGDTHLGESAKVRKHEREKHLQTLWRQFQTSEVVLTDRLHGMIFAYITKTPCIVFENANPKIRSTYYDWLKECNFIKLVSKGADSKSIIEIMNELRKVEPVHVKLNGKFDYFAELVKGKANV